MKRRFAALILIISVLLASCGGSRELVLHNNELLAVDQSVCSWSEAQIFIMAQYAIYGRAYGDGIWSTALSEGSFESYIKDGLMNYLKLLFLADHGARQMGVRLSEAEQKSVDRAAKDFMAALGEEGARRTGITEESARLAYTHYAMSQIFYRQVIMDARLEISDEEARIISLEIVESDPSKGYEQIREIAEKLKSSKSLSEALRGYEGVNSRKENVARGTYSEEFDSLTFSLKKEQWTPIFTENGRYLVVQCLSPYMEEETALRKAQMEMSAREETLNKALESFAESVQLIYNPQLWNSWSMSQYSSLPTVNFYDYSAALEK